MYRAEFFVNGVAITDVIESDDFQEFMERVRRIIDAFSTSLPEFSTVFTMPPKEESKP